MKKYALWAVYSVLFLLFLFQMFYYRENLYNIPDEDTHISYLAYVQENPDKWFPEYQNIRLCRDRMELPDGICRYTVGNTIVSLKKPLFYYKAMQLVGGVVTQELAEGQSVYVDLGRLKTANIYLTAVVMILILYLCYTKLGKLTQSVFCHALAAVAVTIVGGMAKYGACIRNDNLANVGTVLFVWGFFQYVEKKEGWTKHFLVAAGILITLAGGFSVRGYLPLLVLAAVMCAVWLINGHCYRLWHLLGYKAKARRIRRENTKKVWTPEQPAVFLCVLAALMLCGGFGFSVLADAGGGAYNWVYDLNQRYQLKRQGYFLLYADTGERANDIEEAGYLLQGLVVEQDFEVTEEMLAYEQLGIALQTGTYNRKNDIPLYVELYQDSGFGKAYKIDCSRVKDDEYVEVVFSTEELREEACHIKIYSEATNSSQAVTVHTTKNCLLAPGMKVAGSERERNLVMRVYTPYGAKAVK